MPDRLGSGFHSGTPTKPVELSLQRADEPVQRAGEQHELRVQSRELAASLRDSHNKAIATGRRLDVTINFEPPQYIVEQDKPHILPEGITIAATMDLELQPNPSAGHSGRIPEDRFRIRFYPDGSSSGAIITLRRESLAYTLKVGWLLGRVSMAAGIADDAS